MTVFLITCAAMPGLHHDDRHLLVALRPRGATVAPVVWEDRHVDWGAAALCVTRSVWDYAYRRQEFLTTMEWIASETTLWNSLPLRRWNTHKRYLCDLAPVERPNRAHPGPSRRAPAELSSVVESLGWSTVVIKAAVGQ